MSTKPIFFDRYWKNLFELSHSPDSSKLSNLTYQLLDCRARGGKVITVGNGGSAAIASHVTVDLTKAAGIRATCFNESSVITCFANDYGYERWVEKAIDFYADDNDLIILISSSGRSKNILNCARLCAARKLSFATFSGFESTNPLRAYGDLSFWVDSNNYNQVETIHQTWLLAAIDFAIETQK